MPETYIWTEFVALHGETDENTIVHVAEGTTLVFDQASGATPIEIGGLLIEGEVVFEDDPDASYEISTDFILAHKGGAFRIGSDADPFQGDVTISLTAEEGAPFDIRSSELTVSSTGEAPTNAAARALEDMIRNKNNNFIMAMGEGSEIDIHADDAGKASWVSLNETVEGDAGTNTIVVDTDGSGWEAGDSIAITASFYDMDEVEEFTIVAIDGNTLTLDGEIQFDHIGEVKPYANQNGEKIADFRAKVMLLSRDVTIQGDVDYDSGDPIDEQSDSYGGHIMVMNSADLHLSGAELAFMGQEDARGRYAVHAHELGETGSFVVENNSIHHSFHKGVTVHSTDNAIVDNNVIYEVNEQGIFLEDSGSGSLITNNVISTVRKMGSEAAGIWIETSGQIIQGNTISGVDGNGAEWDSTVDSNPENFSGNTIQSVFRAVASDQGTLGDVKNVTPTEFDTADHIAIKDVSIGWVDTAIWEQQGQGMYVDGAVIVEAEKGTRLRKNQSLEDAVIVGDSGLFADSDDYDVEGHQIYDGPSAVIDVTFHNFNDDDVAIKQTNSVEPMLSHAFDGVAFVNTEEEIDLHQIGMNGKPYKIYAAIDLDGSVTGFAGAHIIPYKDAGDFYRTEQTYEVDAWDALVSPDARIGNFVIHDDGGRDSEFRVFRENGATLGWASATDGQGAAHHGFFMNGETYRMEFQDSNNVFDMHVMEMAYGDSVTYEIHGLDIATSFTEIEKFSRDDDLSIREVSSLEMLNASTDTAVYRDLDTGVIHMKFVADGKVGWHNANAGATFDDALLTGAMIHVDQRAGSLVDLDDLAFDDPEGPADARYDGSGADDLFYAFSGNDTLLGRDGADTLHGGLGNDQINGGRGDDELFGNSGNDSLRGQGGDDLMAGNSGDDDLRGGGGADTLIGGAGSDRLHGGGGSDTFVLGIDKTFGVTDSRDVVRDFALGTDVLEFADLSPADDLAEHIQIEARESGSFVSVLQSATDEFVDIAILEGLSVTLDDLIASDAILI